MFNATHEKKIWIGSDEIEAYDLECYNKVYSHQGEWLVQYSKDWTKSYNVIAPDNSSGSGEKIIDAIRDALNSVCSVSHYSSRRYL